MTTPIGKFDVRPDIRYISRWEVEMLQSMIFNDPVHGLITVPEGLISDLPAAPTTPNAVRR